MYLSSVLRQHAARQPEAEAVVSSDGRIPYGQLDDVVDRVAGGLAAHGVRPGGRVACWLSNRAEFVYTYLACVRLGAAFVPINPRFAVPEAKSLVASSGACALVGEAAFGEAGRIAALRDVAAQLEPPALLVVVGPSPAGALPFADLLQGPRQQALPEREALPGEVAIVLYTSGTTGRPKGAMLTQGGLAAYGASALQVGLFAAGERVLVQVPLATTAGSVIQTVPTLCAGGTLVLMETFKAEPSLALIEAERITCYVAPPTILALQLAVERLREYDLSSLRHVITGAAPVPRDLATRVAQVMGARIINCYGATETGGLVTYMPASAPQEKVVCTSGVPMPGYEIRIVDEDRAAVPRGTVGEIAVRGGSVAVGYLLGANEEAHAADDGWWFSGDLGSIDEDGYLSIVGRRKEMYIRGGFNVYPAEVEAVLYQLPDVVTCAVVGFSDPVLGEKGRAFVVPSPGSSLTPDAVREFCHERIADYKVPDEVVLVDDLPLIGPGKVDRSGLATLAPKLGITA